MIEATHALGKQRLFANVKARAGVDYDPTWASLAALPRTSALRCSSATDNV